MNHRAVMMTLTSMLVVPHMVPGACKTEKQAEVKAAVRKTLDALYKAQPSARKAVQSAAGYAAFSNFGMKILLAGSDAGEDIAFNNRSKRDLHEDGRGTDRIRHTRQEMPAGLGVRERERAE
jgi:hypothetical protein